MNITKNISVDFSGGVCNVIQFRIELANATNKFDTLDQNGDEIVLHFTETLNSDEIVVINNLILNHIPDNSYNKTSTQPLIISPSSVNSTFFTTWTTINVFIFKGTLQLGIPQEIEIIVHIQDTVVSGAFRIIDRSNGNVILQKNNIVNKQPKLLNIGVGTQWPKGEQILEIQMKQTGSINEQNIVFYEMKIDFTI